MMTRCILAAILFVGCWGGAEPALAAKKWRTKEDCTLIDNPANDGDSFHIRVNRRAYIFRLLWVDTPETDNRFPDRVAEQAAYFGISPENAIKVGKDATRFSAEFLRRQPFTVYTQFDDAMGSSEKDRDYAVIKSGAVFLMEALVENGLARIHGLQELPPDAPSLSAMRMRLKGLENDAKKNRRGAWGYAGPALSRFELMNKPPEIAEQTLTLSQALPVYSLVEPGRVLGTLFSGQSLTVLRAESISMIRIRFTLPDGRTLEAQARRIDLGL